MPKLKLHMQDGGIRFNAHVADAPQCGPSRSSTLTGRAVHNTKFYINADPDQASFKNYAAVQNQTIGPFLSGAGYHTAFLGKYVNGLECVPNPKWEGQPTWSYWYATCNTCKCSRSVCVFFGRKAPKSSGCADVLYNSSYVNNAGELIVSTGEYQTDHLGQQAIAQIEAAKRASKPFCAPRGALFLCASGTARGLTDAGGVQTSTSRPWRRTPRRATIRGRSR